MIRRGCLDIWQYWHNDSQQGHWNSEWITYPLFDPQVQLPIINEHKFEGFVDIFQPFLQRNSTRILIYCILKMISIHLHGRGNDNGAIDEYDSRSKLKLTPKQILIQRGKLGKFLFENLVKIADNCDCFGKKHSWFRDEIINHIRDEKLLTDTLIRINPKVYDYKFNQHTEGPKAVVFSGVEFFIFMLVLIVCVQYHNEILDQTCYCGYVTTIEEELKRNEFSECLEYNDSNDEFHNREKGYTSVMDKIDKYWYDHPNHVKLNKPLTKQEMLAIVIYCSFVKHFSFNSFLFLLAFLFIFWLVQESSPY